MAAEPGAQGQRGKLVAELCLFDIRVQQALDGGFGDRAGWSRHPRSVRSPLPPRSIMRAAMSMPLRKARQALPTSKFRQWRRQAQVAVHDAGSGGLEIIPRHGSVDDDARRAHGQYPLSSMRLLGGQGGGIRRLCAFFPHTPRRLMPEISSSRFSRIPRRCMVGFKPLGDFP